MLYNLAYKQEKRKPVLIETSKGDARILKLLQRSCIVKTIGSISPSTVRGIATYPWLTNPMIE
jgi:hypothetical protein